MKSVKYFLWSFVLIIPFYAKPNTLNVPADYSTIQEAIDAAQNGDTVLVANGSYSGNGNDFISIGDKEIVVKSQNGPENCIIEGGGTGYLGFSDSQSNNNAVIEGFTIRNFIGHGFDYFAGTCPCIKNNVVENNSIGIYFNGGAPIIEHNIIRNNRGAGIHCSRSEAKIISNTINGNSGDTGAGIDVSNSRATIVNNLIFNNSAKDYGGGIYAYKDSSVYLNNTVANNKSKMGAGFFIKQSEVSLFNNIIVNSELFIFEDGERLDEWRKGSTSARYSYNNGLLSGVELYEGFVNFGKPDYFTINVYGLNDTSIFVDTYERISFTIFCSISGGFTTNDYRMSSFIYNETDTLKIESVFQGNYNSTYALNITRHGIDALPSAIVTSESSNLPIHYCCFNNNPGNYTSISADTINIEIIDFNGNISVNPLFDNETFELLTGSPCIDAGTPDLNGLDPGETDFDSNPRVYDGNGDGIAVIDIGAYEAQELTIETEEYVSVCQGETYEGHTESGDFQRTLTASTGADSVVTTHLTVFPTYETGETAAICEGDEYMGYTEEGDYPQTYQTINECDSTVVIQLTVYPAFKPTFTSDGERLTADQEYQTYQWHNSDGIIEGATNREFVLEETGHYRLEATNENGCTCSSDEVYVIRTSVDNFKNKNFGYSLFPNPANGYICFRIDAAPPQKITIELSTLLGQIIKKRELYYPVAGDQTFFDVTEINDGIYQVVVVTNAKISTQKICIIR
ncbi:MAG: right-handed parallel beta-helix repeat-containing protein [Prolixibacteraceae bacterium]|nr:right-handed parallel beta-helix repeat-containing protein [Prolixibacteraceae bacterium]